LRCCQNRKPIGSTPATWRSQGAVVHELEHAEQDKAAAGPKIQSADRDRNELYAYRTRCRFRLDTALALTGAARATAVQQAASVWDPLLAYAMALEARTDLSTREPLLRAINATAPAASRTAARDISTARTWPEPRVEAFLLGLIRRAYAITTPVQNRVTEEGLGGESILDWNQPPDLGHETYRPAAVSGARGADAAAEAGVSHEYVRRVIRQGRIRAVRVGNGERPAPWAKRTQNSIRRLLLALHGSAGFTDTTPAKLTDKSRTRSGSGRARGDRPGSAVAAGDGPRMSRKEAKLLTRARLLDAARKILLTDGEGAISASAVVRAVGVANATFYEHFANKDDLLRMLAEELFASLRDKLRAPRQEAIDAPTSEEKLRRQLRVPLEVLATNPGLFRLALRVRHQPASALGKWSLRLTGSTRRDLVQELIDSGYPSSTPVERRRLEMIADIHVAATEALALGRLSGRYPDLEEIVDMLVLVTRGTRLVREMAERPAADARRTSGAGPLTPQRRASR
jgi:TetR/AcrR family transcriptional regulator, fatty acid biosynthesis regulator